MFGLNRLPPLVRTATMMLLLGGLVGYVGTAFTTTFVADSGILGNSGESNAAHKYMLALLQRQSESLSQLGPSGDVVSRALQQQNVSQQPQDVKPLTVTYLGGASSGRVSVQNAQIAAGMPMRQPADHGNIARMIATTTYV